MERLQLAGYRVRPGAASPYAYGARDPITSIRGARIPSDRDYSIGAGLGGAAVFRDPFAVRFSLNQGLPTSPNLPYVANAGLPALRGDPDPLLPHALAPRRRLSTGIDPIFYGNYGQESDCSSCRRGHHRHDSGLGLADRYTPCEDRHRHRHSSDDSRHKYSQPHSHSLILAPRHPFSPDYEHSGNSSCNSKKSEHYEFKTKDIAVRGKTYTVRASYLAEASKFEGDLEKYVSKKSEKVLPEHVVEMLISFINHESYHSYNTLDEVTLNVLASSVSAKSAFEFSLNRLKKIEYAMSARELSEICATVLCSDKTDDKLKTWLKDYIKSDPGRVVALGNSQEFMDLVDERPEIYNRLGELLGSIPAASEESHRII